MATEPSQSDVNPAGLTPSEPALPLPAARSGEQYIDIWLDGEVVGCSCPECGGPMSIRMWLRLADCPRCPDVSIELSEEIIEDIQRLKREQKRKQKREEDREKRENQKTAAVKPKPSAPAPQPATTPAPEPPPLPSERQASEKRIAAASQPIGVRKKIREMATSGTASVWRRELTRDMPAWLVSALLHLAGLLILAMFIIEAEAPPDPYITLGTETSREKLGGGQPGSDNMADFDAPIDPNDLPDTHDPVVVAQDARELRMDADTIVPYAQSYKDVKAAVKSNDPNVRAVAVRDPRVRAEMVQKEGGTLLTEAAVTRGLRWMARHQNADGSWSLNGFNRAGDCRGRCGGHGNVPSKVAGTALALLPYLGAGQTHLVGLYQNEVSAGLRYLLSVQKENGDLRDISQHGMYAHGQAALVLCEAYKMTGDETFRDPAQRAVNFIVGAQHLGGGWRYRPYYEKGAQPPDTSVLGWQVMALHSAKAAYLDVEPSALKLAQLYLDKAQTTKTLQIGNSKVIRGRAGGLYCYEPSRRAFKATMTAEGLLCRMFLGWKLEHPGLQEGVSYLMKHHLPDVNHKDMYYWYYGTQMMHHVGGKPWDRWNQKMRDILVRLQSTKGHEKGSWPPSTDSHGGAGGRLYTTAFATAILEVYYRHAPLFRQIDLQ